MSPQAGFGRPQYSPLEPPKAPGGYLPIGIFRQRFLTVV